MPQWARDALATEPERSWVKVDGAAIEVLAWGDRSLPGLLLLHGSRASAEWWMMTAPLLMHDYRVVALSLSGMGRSGWRERYGVAQYAREALGVAEVQRLFAGPRKPIFAAHSFGGYAALAACLTEGDRIGGVVLIDTLLQDLTMTAPGWQPPLPEPVRTYASIAEALSRFRLIPSRPTDCLWALDEIARRSLKVADESGAWTWQFDNALFARMERQDLRRFTDIRTPVAVIRGELSDLFHPEIRQNMADLFGTNIPDVVIPQAGHHVMIDQPLALIAALRSLLSAWPSLCGQDRRSALGSTQVVYI